MGNKCANLEYAEWEDGTKCGHGHSLSAYRVTEIRWIRVPMSSGFMRGTTQVARVVFGVATLGTTAWVNGGVKDLSRECIEILTTCKYWGIQHDLQLKSPQTIHTSVVAIIHGSTMLGARVNHRQ